MEFASFLVFESEHLNLSLARKSFNPARFSSTLGSASGALEIAKPSEDLQLIRQIESDLVSNIAFGNVVDLQVWHYFFGIWVVEFRVDIAPTVVTRTTILEWDNQTDVLQDLVAAHLELNLHEKIRPKWSTSLFLGQCGETSELFGTFAIFLFPTALGIGQSNRCLGNLGLEILDGL